MKKKLLLIFLCYSAIATNFAQSKMNFSLARNIQENETNVNEQVGMLIQGNVSQIELLVTEVGGKFNYSAGNIASVSISINQLSQIISNNAIQRVEAFPPSKQPLNDSMLVNANVVPVHNGVAPLPQMFDGTGVIVGFIDTGLDLTHADFQDASGKTRVLWLWDQTKNSGGILPAPAYGQQWDKAAIDAGLASSHTDPTGHGTHVAGVGVGNGLSTATANFNGKGVAPKADIIVVALDFNNGTNNTIVDAVQYIYSKAFAAGKPCVINASLGSDYGMHDGNDLESQAIKGLINQRPGQAFAAAAGNSGAAGMCHLAYARCGTDTNFTLFAPVALPPPSTGYRVYMDIIADSSDLANMVFAIGADQMAPSHSFRGNIPFSAVSSMPLGSVVTTFLKNGANQQIGKVQSFLDKVNGVYDLQYFITPDSTTYDWRLMAKGCGKFDLWNYNSSGSSYSPIVSSIPTKATMPDSAFYKYPDADKSIEGGFQCLDEVIAVGNYQNRRSYPDCNGNLYKDTTLIVGSLIAKSSIGPTRDGRVKPDVVAPGDMTLAARSVLVGSPNFKMAVGCKHIRDGGTSHSCPVVAGVAALYLQKNPTATAIQVQQAIIRCTIKDNFTGNNLPDKYWGYGKIDGFRTLTDCITIVITTQPKDSSICNNADATFAIVASGSGLTYQWQVDQGAGFVNLSNTSPYNGINTNTLTITSATVALNGYKYRCIVKDIYLYTATSNSGILTVNPLPTITTAATATNLCYNNSSQTTSLTYSSASNTPTTYNLGWDATALAAGFVAINNSALPSSPISITVPAGAVKNVYNGTITVKNANGCVSGIGNFTVAIDSLPIVTATAGHLTLACSNSSATVSLATTNGTNILWTHNGTGSITSGANTLTPTYLTATTDEGNKVVLTMSASSTNNCGTTTANTSDTVFVGAPPVVNISGLASNYCYDAVPQTLTGTPAGGTFSGVGITNGATGIFDPVIAGSGNKTISYTYTDVNNCTVSASSSTNVLTQTVSQDSCKISLIGLNDNIANIFTPNNDGVNDEFKVNYTGAPASDFNLSIFDRWGTPIFISTNPNVKWDGRTTAGIKATAGTYFYVLINAGTKYKGYVSLFE